MKQEIEIKFKHRFDVPDGMEFEFVELRSLQGGDYYYSTSSHRIKKCDFIPNPVDRLIFRPVEPEIELENEWGQFSSGENTQRLISMSHQGLVCIYDDGRIKLDFATSSQLRDAAKILEYYEQFSCLPERIEVKKGK